MDYKAKRREWRGQTYDSQLEADWAATFTAWGMEFRYHPGRLFLSSGDVYEPDFQLEFGIFEVKGDHDQRIDKAWRAKVESGRPVIIAHVDVCVANPIVRDLQQGQLLATEHG